jgi:hypothetical protein
MRPACAGRKCASADMDLVVDATIGTDGPTGTFQETPTAVHRLPGAAVSTVGMMPRPAGKVDRCRVP